MFFSSIALVVAAGCVLGHAGMPAERVTTCVDNVVHRLSCELSGVIRVQTSLYRSDGSVACSEGQKAETYEGCSDVAVFEIVKKKCDGKRVCELTSGDVGVSDSCREGTKYLETTYTCLPAVHHVTCEHSLAQLQCGEDQVIFVYEANYGRRDRTTCIRSRPDSQIQNVNCLNPTGKVAERCNGKNSCFIKAGNSEFGDPCYGTYKYLELAYTCNYSQDLST